MKSKVKIALVGIGGYGEFYIGALLGEAACYSVDLVGAVDLAPERCSKLELLKTRQCPIYRSLDELYGNSPVDLTIISTPIHLHARQTCEALRHGSNVLCEKPLAGSLADAQLMLEAEKQSSKFIAIGYQWSFSPAIQSLKADILTGTLGKPIRFKTIAHYPRGFSYFRRNNWAGRLHNAAGDSIFDSPVNNATAHFLHNMLYLLGDRINTSAQPREVQAELSRANEIENYDTAALRVVTSEDVEVLFFTSHCVARRQEPKSVFEFENAIVDFDGTQDAEFIARFKNGGTKSYGSPGTDHRVKLLHAIDCVRTGKRPVCGVEAALAQTVTVTMAQKTQAEIVNFPTHLRKVVPIGNDSMIAISGLQEILENCFAKNVLPSELGIAWDRLDPNQLHEPAVSK